MKELHETTKILTTLARHWSQRASQLREDVRVCGKDAGAQAQSLLPVAEALHARVLLALAEVERCLQLAQAVQRERETIEERARILATIPFEPDNWGPTHLSSRAQHRQHNQHCSVCRTDPDHATYYDSDGNPGLKDR